MSRVYPFLPSHETVGRTLRDYKSEEGTDFSVVELRDRRNDEIIPGVALRFIRDDARRLLIPHSIVHVVHGEADLIVAQGPDLEFRTPLSAGIAEYGHVGEQPTFLQRMGKGELVLREITKSALA